MNRQTIGISVILVMLFGGITLYLFKPTQVNSAKWNKSYSLFSDQPYGLSIFKGLLEHKYSADAVKVCDGLCPLPQGDARGYCYIYVGEYYYRPQSYIDELMEFTHRGGRVLIITEDFELMVDCIPIESQLKLYEAQEATLQSEDAHEFRFRHVMNELDSVVDKSFFSASLMDSIGNASIDTLLSITDSITIFKTVHTEQGQISFHTLPDMFANVSMKYGDGLPQFNYVINHSIGDHSDSKYSSHTQLLDTQHNKTVRSSKRKKESTSKDDSILLDNEENNVQDERSADFNPIQFIFANPALKWSYLIILLGAGAYIYFTGKRRQLAIPTLELNTNTSLEFVDTLSDLFISQNNPSQLVDHMEENLKQFIKRKYFIDSNTTNYIQRVSQKSKIDRDEVTMLFQRIEAAKHNERFREEQLINLNQTIEEFYKKCQ